MQQEATWESWRADTLERYGSREEGKVRLLKGEGRFVADLRVSGMRELAFVRSPHAHARVLSVDGSAAWGVPGVEGVLTPEDLPPQALQGEIPPLAGQEVRYVGQPVAAVWARDRYAAEDGAEAVAVTYDPLPARAHPEDPPPAPQEVAYEDEVTYGDLAEAYARAEVTVELRQNWSRASAQPLEPRGILCLPDPLGGLTVYAAHQAPHALRYLLSRALGLEEERVRVVAPDVGGGFGCKNGLYPEDVVCALVALRTLGPVRYLEDRREHFSATTHERDQYQRVRLLARKDGTLLGLDADIVADHGAYRLRFPIVSRTALDVPVAYRIPAYRVRVRSVLTHKTPQGPYRGAGRPQANFLMERAMDRLAQTLGMDPIALRRKNLRPPSAQPWVLAYQTRHGPRPITVDSPNPAPLLEEAERHAQVLRSQAQKRAQRRGGLPGVGVALSVEQTGAGPYEAARAVLARDGRVHVTCGAPSQGQGHETVFAQLVAQVLDVPIRQVVVEPTDTARLPLGIGTFGSRTATSGAVAVHRAAVALAEKVKEAAARLWEADPQDVVLQGGSVAVRGTPSRSLTLAELADRLSSVLPGPWGAAADLSATATPSAPVSVYGASAHVAAVVVDPQDLRVHVVGYLVAYDVGRRLHPAIVEAQLLGGLAHGLSAALLEEIRYDGEGQLLTQSYLDYLLPGAQDMPPVRFAVRETPTSLTPLGARGVGESATITAPAALVAAVEDALGVPLDRIPMTPSRLWEAWRAFSPSTPRG